MGGNSSPQGLHLSPQSPQVEGELQPGRAGLTGCTREPDRRAHKSSQERRGETQAQSGEQRCPDPANQALKGTWACSQTRRGVTRALRGPGTSPGPVRTSRSSFVSPATPGGSGPRPSPRPQQRPNTSQGKSHLLELVLDFPPAGRHLFARNHRAGAAPPLAPTAPGPSLPRRHDGRGGAHRACAESAAAILRVAPFKKGQRGGGGDSACARPCEWPYWEWREGRAGRAAILGVAQWVTEPQDQLFWILRSSSPTRAPTAPFQADHGTECLVRS